MRSLHGCARSVLLVVAMLAVAGPAPGAIDAYSFPDEESRERYNRLIEELRCPQCLNTNIAGSDSMIAKDLRREVHRLILEGMGDEEILDYMQHRYGDFILYRPRVMGTTLLLWFGPLFILLLALWYYWRLLASRSRVEATDLSNEEEARLRKLLSENPAEPADEEK